MTDTQRFAALEVEIADLKRRDTRREAEHRNLLKTYEEMIAGREAMRRETDETMKLFKDYWDERIAGWQKRLAAGGGDDGEIAAMLREFAKDAGALVAEALAAQEARIMARVSSQFEKMATAQGNIGDAIERLLDAHAAA